MKSLIVIALSVIMSNAMASTSVCNITLGVKKIDAKSAKLSGVSFSAKQIEALKTVCTVELEKMSKDELVADFKASLDRKEARDAKKETASN